MDPKEGTRHGGPKSTADKYPELNTLLDDMRDAGMVVTKKWMDIWFTAINYVWGQQLQGWKLKKKWKYIVMNRIYPLMFQTIAKLAGNNPKILTHAWDDESEGATEFAEKWAGHLQYLWESPYELNMRLKLIKGLLDCGVFGYMVGKTQWEAKPRGGWNDKDKNWTGKAIQYFCHPGRFWCDPSAEIVDAAENLGTTRRAKLEWAQARWPEFAEEIEAEAYTSKDSKYTATDLITYGSQKSSTISVERQRMFSRMAGIILGQSAVTGDASSTDAIGGDRQRYVDIEETYWRDYKERHVKIEDNIPKETLLQNGTITEEEATGLFIDTKTGKPLEEWPKEVTAEYDEPLYPNGRFVLRIGKTILNPQTKSDENIHEDFASAQVYKRQRWPFNVMPYHILPHMWQGGNAVEGSKNNNDMLNITMSSMVQQVRRTADPTKIIEAGALAKDRKGKVRSKFDDITGLGRIIVAARGKIKAIMNMVYPRLDPAVQLLADALKKDIDAQEFMHPIARGETEGPKKTKAEALTLNQNALDYVGLQGIFLDKWIDDTGSSIADICQRNYKLGRLIKMLSDDVKSGMKATKEMFDVRFDVNIEPGSTLPFDERKKQEEYGAAYKLLENPIPNPMIEDMLRVLNISKRKEILAKYQGLQLFRQFIQMGALLTEVQSEPEVQTVMKQMLAIPGMQQLIQLLLQVGQLAPQMGKGVNSNDKSESSRKPGTDQK